MRWLAFSILAMVLAVIFAVGVAAPHAPRDGIRRVILRWFHALTWVLLAACFLSLAFDLRPGVDPSTLALMGLASYLTFMAKE
jgi:hypothetical protein